VNEPAPSMDTIFRALADPTRLQVVERLSQRPASVTELAAPFDMALPSFVQHLRILEGAGLVRSKKTGRVRTYELRPQRLQAAEGWLSKRRALWERRLDQLDGYLLTMNDNDNDNDNDTNNQIDTEHNK
jgi:DNA-binding transcriptional ArsR family regulator